MRVYRKDSIFPGHCYKRFEHAQWRDTVDKNIDMTMGLMCSLDDLPHLLSIANIGLYRCDSSSIRPDLRYDLFCCCCILKVTHDDMRSPGRENLCGSCTNSTTSSHDKGNFSFK